MIVHLSFEIASYDVFVSPRSQMVFYIEACESGSMMKHLPADINGESNFSSFEKR